MATTTMSPVSSFTPGKTSFSVSHTPLRGGGADSSAGAVDTVWFGSGEVVGFMHTLGGL